PAVAGAPEDVAGLGEMPFRAPVVARRRVDETEPGEDEAEAAAVTLPAPELERLFESPAGRRKRALGQLEVRAPDEHRRLARLVTAFLEPGGALLEQGARSRGVAACAHDSSLVGEDVADGGVAGDLEERLQGVLEDDMQPRPASGVAEPDL